MTLTVLSVAFPFAPVGPDAVGGAEQVLSQIDAALVAAGHRSIVIACEGSQVAGELVAVARAKGPLGDADRTASTHLLYRAETVDVLGNNTVDVVHMHGVDFSAYLPPPGPPVLISLHLPIGWHPPAALTPTRPATWLHCVSQRQHRDCPPTPCLLPPIENGVALRPTAAAHEERSHALMLARICPEKGIHSGIEAAKRARMPLLIGGEVFPYPAHQRYFEEEVRPRLDPWRRFLGPVGRSRKQRLLAESRCVLIASDVAETNSLVAREALAAGAPVIAFARGALVDTIEHGRTGFLVGDVEGMAAAMAQAHTINPEVCRAVARERFSRERMIAGYFDAYRRLAAASGPALAVGAA